MLVSYPARMCEGFLASGHGSELGSQLVLVIHSVHWGACTLALSLGVCPFLPLTALLRGEPSCFLCFLPELSTCFMSCRVP